MRIRYALFAVPFLTACGAIDSPAEFLAKNGYLSLRIVNNELGLLLKEWKLTSLSKAQKEVDEEASQKCQSSDAQCRSSVKDRVAARYAEKELTYNQAATVQRGTKKLLEVADSTCATMTTNLCESAKTDALRNKADVERFWKEVSGW